MKVGDIIPNPAGGFMRYLGDGKFEQYNSAVKPLEKRFEFSESPLHRVPSKLDAPA